MDRGHIELVKHHGDALADTIRGLVHTARFVIVLLLLVQFPAVQCTRFVMLK